MQNPSVVAEPEHVAVFGLGYVGCVTAACLASVGHHVIGVDRDVLKINAILSSRPPFYEPGLDKLVAQSVDDERLTATLDPAVALENADIALICVGTPSGSNGNVDLEQLRRVVADIAQLAEGRGKELIVAIRSTVPPGTCEDIVIPGLNGLAQVVSNPEFLREGAAVKDFMEPSLLVVGGSNRDAVRRVAALYSSLDVEACLVSLRTAEMIKYACNSFHAIKIAFANEIGALSDSMGVDGAEVMDTLCRDHKLNISPAYLKPGFAFGGSCLPKDLRAIVYRARHRDLDLPLFEAALPSNHAHLQRAIDAVLDIREKHIGIVGLAFKENTDDLRESPVITLMERLIGKGRELRVFDPHIQLDSIYGTNRNFILNAIPHIGRLLQPSIGDLLGWAEHLVVAQKPSAELATAIRDSGLPVLDLVGAGLGSRITAAVI
jgi:GDP-mannose 6-dehydrogenase